MISKLMVQVSLYASRYFNIQYLTMYRNTSTAAPNCRNGYSVYGPTIRSHSRFNWCSGLPYILRCLQPALLFAELSPSFPNVMIEELNRAYHACHQLTFDMILWCISAHIFFGVSCGCDGDRPIEYRWNIFFYQNHKNSRILTAVNMSSVTSITVTMSKSLPF
jgi:hypothetical protein